jgi:hypothetical protein
VRCDTCFALVGVGDCSSGYVDVDAGDDGEFVQVCCSSQREQFPSRLGVRRKLGPKIRLLRVSTMYLRSG